MRLTHERLCQLHQIIPRAVVVLPLCSLQKGRSVGCSETVHEVGVFTGLETKEGSLN